MPNSSHLLLFLLLSLLLSLSFILLSYLSSGNLNHGNHALVAFFILKKHFQVKYMFVDIIRPSILLACNYILQNDLLLRSLCCRLCVIRPCCSIHLKGLGIKRTFQSVVHNKDHASSLNLPYPPRMAFTCCFSYLARPQSISGLQ